ncbi:MAG: hypothetical protein ABIR15_03775 [Chitinophagaceae bacterium]
METTDFHEIFTRIKKQLAPYGKKMDVRVDKDSVYHLYIIKDIELAGRKYKECYFGGVLIQKTMVAFYFFPIYSHPTNFVISAPIKKNLKGKSCFNFKKLDDDQEKAIGQLLKEGADLYKKEGIL